MNESKLAAYRKLMERRMVYFRIACLAYLLLMVAGRFMGNTFKDGMLYGMIAGVMAGAWLVIACNVLRLRGALKDDQKLQRLYNEEHDERKAAIRAKAGYPIVVILSLAMICAAMVASFFSEPVTITLMLTALVQLTVCAALKSWYMHRT